MTHRLAWAVATVPAAFVTVTAYGLGTPAGTTITAEAQVSFDMAGTRSTATSNVVAIDVAEIVDVDLLVQTPTRLVYGGASGQPLRLTLSNVGNGTETFSLTPRHAIAGDDFDPIAPLPALVFDSDGDGSLGSADQPYVAGVNDPTLPADGSVSVFLVGDIPVSVGDGDVALVELAAIALAGSGLPGQTFPGVGDSGVDAVIGASGGMAVGTAEYVVGQVELFVTKDAAVRDQAGGTRAVSGAWIDYAIRVSAVGGGSAAAAALVDPIPAGTTYEAGSLAVNGVPVTDAADADAGRYDATLPGVRVDLGAIAASDPARQVNFTVRIE